MYLRLRLVIGTVFILFLMLSFGYGAEPAADAFQLPGRLSGNIEKLHIVVVDFIPLPFAGPGDPTPHSLVFTNEFYSTNPESEKIEGCFIPEDYLKMFHDALRQAAAFHGLAVTLAKNLHEIPSDADVIVLGAVEDFGSGASAEAVLSATLIDARRMTKISSRKFRRVLDAQGLPLIASRPVHTIGNHANNFHPQRALLGFVAYACAMDLYQWIGEEVK